MWEDFEPRSSEQIRFDASESYDPDGGSILSYEWNFGDGSEGSGEVVQHKYLAPGTYTVILTVADDDGETSTAISTIGVGVIGETGIVTVSQPDGSTWHTVDLQNSYTNPVVIMQPVSYNGFDPSHIRIRNVTSDNFQFQIEEWDYITNQAHTEETTSYLVMEAGTWELEDGTKVEVGRFDMGNDWVQEKRWKRVSFGQSFSNAPVVLTQVQTYNGSQAVITRQKDVTSTSFQVVMREEEKHTDGHVTETIGYIAIEPGSGTNDGARYEAGRTANAVTHEWYTINFSQSYSSPLFLAWIETTDGGDTAGLRYRNLGVSSVEVFVEEETSNDSETSHADEVVGYFVFESAGDLLGDGTPSELPGSISDGDSIGSTSSSSSSSSSGGGGGGPWFFKCIKLV
jgi:PKD repeat protein